MTVVVYKYWRIDKTIRKLKAEHNKVTGTPTPLEIKLYYSSWLIRYGEQPFKTVIIEYEKTKKYEIYYSESEKSWRTYLPGTTKSNNHRPIKRKSTENIEKEIIKFYIENQEIENRE